MNHDIKDIALADEGLARILWADRDMPVLASIRERFERERPLEGVRIGACLHVTTETANLVRTLMAWRRAGVRCARRNPLSTQDDTAAALVQATSACSVFAIAGEDTETYYRHVDAIIDAKPADHHGRRSRPRRPHPRQPLHRRARDGIIGGTEETTTGVIRLEVHGRPRERSSTPSFAVNDANTKHFFDNRYGTGQSTLDGIVRADESPACAGRTFVVSGYGCCGKRPGHAGKGHGHATSIVCEVDPLEGARGAHGGLPR